MHVLQLLAVEANSTEEAEAETVNIIDGFFTETSRNVWFDWYEIGGRWNNTAFNNDSNALCLTDKEQFDRIIEDARATRQKYASLYLKDMNFSEIEKLLTTADYATSSNSYPIYGLHGLTKMFLNFWSPNSDLYDLVEDTGNVEYLQKRVEDNPKKQWLVAVDFHY